MRRAESAPRATSPGLQSAGPGRAGHRGRARGQPRHADPPCPQLIAAQQSCALSFLFPVKTLGPVSKPCRPSLVVDGMKAPGHGWPDGPGLGWFGPHGPQGLITADCSASEFLIWLPFDFLSASPEERAWHSCDPGLGGVGCGWPCFGPSSRPPSETLVQEQPVQEVTWGHWRCQPSGERCFRR